MVFGVTTSENKRFLKIDKTTSGMYSFNEIYDMFKRSMYKKAYACHSYLNLDIEDVFQILSIKLWQTYNDYNDTDIGFAWLADNFLNYAISKVRKTEYSDKRITQFKTTSYDAPIVFEDGNDIPLEYAFEDNKDYYKYVDFKLGFNQFINKLPNTQRGILIDKINGFNQVKLAKKYKMSQANISRNLKRTYKNFKEEMA
jgi:RNA polymerase sigma factor (sigma-70 family)